MKLTYFLSSSVAFSILLGLSFFPSPLYAIDNKAAFMLRHQTNAHAATSKIYVSRSSKMTARARGKLKKIASKYEEALFDYNPEMAVYFRKEVELDRFKDHSLKALIVWQKKEDDFLTQLNRIDPNDLKGHPEYHTYHLLKETIVNNQAARLNKEELWNINPQPINSYDFWHSSFTLLAERQPVGTPENRKLALKRWRTSPKVIEDEMHNLKVGLKEGYTAPRIIVEHMIDTLNEVLQLPIEGSPYFDFAKRDGTPEFHKEVKDLIQTSINPAIREYVNFLQNEYLPKARTSIGISELLPKRTSTRYAIRLKKESTLSLSAEAVYEYGIAHMKGLNQEISALGKKIFNETDPHKIFELAKTDPRFRFRNEQEILEYNQKALDRAMQALPLWFKRIPKSPCVLKPYPLHIAKTGAVGEYHPPSSDGVEPGIYYLNTYKPEDQNCFDCEATLFHELIPGHHYQSALLMEDKSQLPLNKYLGNSGYDEGWGLYSERLADEMKLYSDDISRLGMLANEALRTARLVVDPGIHVKHWSRDQAVDYLRKHTTLDESSIQSETDRYIMAPGQAPSYMLGKREIDNLLKMARDIFLEKFDIKEFHDQVLKNGAVTLPELRENINVWISCENKPDILFSNISSNNYMMNIGVF